MKQKTMCKEAMKRDLLKVYRKVTSERSFKSQTEAYQHVVEHEAPRFYVDAKWALQRLSPMMHGDNSAIENMKPLARQMYEDLFNKVLEMKQKERYWNASLYSIVKDAVQEPSPRFYIQADTIRHAWREFMRRRKKLTEKENYEEISCN